MTAAFLGIGGTPGGGELLVVLFAILLLFGSRRLPGMARSLGRALEAMRRAAADVRGEIFSAQQDLEASLPDPSDDATECTDEDGERDAS